MAPLLTRFVATPPRHRVGQAHSFAWLARAHAIAEAAERGLDARECHAFAETIERVLGRVGCPATKIAHRGFAIDDLTNRSWDDNELYDVHRGPHGRGTLARTRRFAELADAYFTTAYAAEPVPPDDLIHVTCTGYASPSAAQKLVARRGWGARTRVTHAYQMGCYAAVPAIRIAAGFHADRRQVDIVHTELCSLHLDPTDHSLEQLVVQSLFADGLIRYSLGADDGGPGLRLLGVHEEIVVDTAGAMAWIVGDHGMQMTLARDVPELIAGALRPFVTELLRRADLDLGHVRASQFAVHPGGPKIIDRVRDVLELGEAQLATSRAVLFDHGNMSSATLPHVWLRMLADPGLARGTPIVSLAFGPGLTLCGAVFEKR